MKTYIEAEFEVMIEAVHDMHPSIIDYLYKVRFHRWTKRHFPRHRYNTMTTNIIKSFNAIARSALDLPIIILTKFIQGTLR